MWSTAGSPHFHIVAGPEPGGKDGGNIVGHLEKGLAYGVTMLMLELL